MISLKGTHRTSNVKEKRARRNAPLGNGGGGGQGVDKKPIFNYLKPDSSNNYYYNKHLLSNAKDLRKKMTKAEACLWKYVLRAGGIKGFTFRRQRPILNYIADFMCKELLLIIEVDGITHTYEEVIQKDKRRQEDLERAGFMVIRFTDDEVLHHINAVYSEIERKVVEIMEIKDISAPQRRKGQKRSES